MNETEEALAGMSPEHRQEFFDDMRAYLCPPLTDEEKERRHRRDQYEALLKDPEFLRMQFYFTDEQSRAIHGIGVEELHERLRPLGKCVGIVPAAFALPDAPRKVP